MRAVADACCRALTEAAAAGDLGLDVLLDIIGDAPGKRYEDSLRILAGDKGVDAILVLNCPTAVASSRA